MDKIFFENMYAERKKLFDIYRQTPLTQLVPEIVHKQIIPWATYSPWETDKAFKKIYTHIQKIALADIYKCYELWTLAGQLGKIKGDVIEIGVWRGGSGAIIAKASEGASDCTVHLCDTFEGVVKAGKKDTKFKGGELSDTSAKIVSTLMKQLHLKNVSVHKGVFPDAFKSKFKDTQFKFCHIDVDTYGSARESFEFIWPRLSSKGIVVFDDYGIWGCEGVTRFFNEIKVPGLKMYNVNGHGIIIKY